MKGRKQRDYGIKRNRKSDKKRKSEEDEEERRGKVNI